MTNPVTMQPEPMRPDDEEVDFYTQEDAELAAIIQNDIDVMASRDVEVVFGVVVIVDENFFGPDDDDEDDDLYDGLDDSDDDPEDGNDWLDDDDFDEDDDSADEIPF